MALTIAEKNISRSNEWGQNPVIEVKYVIEGTDDDAVARALMTGTAPAVRQGWWAQSARVVQEDGNPQQWTGIVVYGPPQAVSGRGNDLVYEFETSGGTQHIASSLNTPRRYKLNPFIPDDAIPNFNQLINVDEVGKVSGVDRVLPIYQWSEEHFFPGASVTPAFRGRLFDLTGCVNNASFSDFNAGEVLFMGASGRRRGGPSGPDWSITYRFAASPNATEANQRLVVKSSLGTSTPIIKDGWDYFWEYTEPGTILAGNVTVHVAIPICGNVEKIYASADFNLLGIPVVPYVPPANQP